MKRCSALALLLTAFMVVTPYARGSYIVTNLYSFGSNYTNYDGANPFLVIQGSDGTLYGTTVRGGTNNNGTIFRLTTNGFITPLHSFTGLQDGGYPFGLVQGRGSYFYGTTSTGGANNNGTVYKMDTNGVITTLHSFATNIDGSNPAGLIIASDGNIYGLTIGDLSEYDSYNPSDNGTIFRITTNGAYSTLHSFGQVVDMNGDVLDGYAPGNQLMQGKDGNLYGVTEFGGTNIDIYNTSGYGTVFKITLGGSFSTIYSFGNIVDLSSGDVLDGAEPYEALGLVQGTDGLLYGTTISEGNNFTGTIFKITTNGALTTLYEFGSNTGTATGLVAANNGLFYGATEAGGSENFPFTGGGTIYSISPVGTFTLVAQMNGINNQAPIGPPIQGTDGNFYGATFLGGAGNFIAGGDGSIYKMTTNGLVTSLYLFGTHDPNGAVPVAGLSQGVDGNYYGSTYDGGAGGINGGFGTIFRSTKTGTHTVLFSFGGTNGANPMGKLIQANNGAYFGTTAFGGPNGCGTVFSITTNGNLASIFSFNWTNGATPSAGLTWANDGSLWGTTFLGGTYGFGTIFRITTNGTFTSYVSFDGTNGANPVSGLVKGSDGSLYGTTFGNGTNYIGTVFKIGANGVLTNIYSFGQKIDQNGNILDGYNPVGGLVQGADGFLYGTTSYGGTNNSNGTIFKTSTNGLLTTLYSLSDSDGHNPAANLVFGKDGSLFGTTAVGTSLFSFGTVFNITTNGAFNSIYFFNGVVGSYPVSELAQDSEGSFYGNTLAGGTNGYGGIFGAITTEMQPGIIGISLQGTNLTLNCTNGVSGGTYYVLASTNVSLPFNQWNPVVTNTINITGNFSITVTNTLSPITKQRFYILELE